MTTMLRKRSRQETRPRFGTLRRADGTAVPLVFCPHPGAPHVFVARHAGDGSIVEARIGDRVDVDEIGPGQGIALSPEMPCRVVVESCTMTNPHARRNLVITLAVFVVVALIGLVATLIATDNGEDSGIEACRRYGEVFAPEGRDGTGTEGAILVEQLRRSAHADLREAGRQMGALHGSQDRVQWGAARAALDTACAAHGVTFS